VIGQIDLRRRGGARTAPTRPFPQEHCILEVWDAIKPTDFPNYDAGTWGPETAETLLTQEGHRWVTPTFLQCQEDQPVCRVTGVQP